MLTPEGYLLQKNFKLKGAPGQWQTACPFCSDKARSGGHLYVNREHGAWMCQRCGESGSFYSLQKRLGDEPEPYYKDLASKWDIWAKATALFQDAIIEKPEILKYLRDRGLTARTIGKYKLGWAKKDFIDSMVAGGTSIRDLKNAGLMVEKDNKTYPLFWDRIMIPYLQRDKIVTVRGKQINGNTIQAKDTSIALFGADNLLGHKEVYICEGEMDAMYLDQLGYPACAIPGAQSFQEHWKPWFDGARRVFVCLDADEAGIQGAHKIKAHLGEKARIVDLPVPRDEDTTDIGEYFMRDDHTKKDFDRMISEARGQRVFTYAQAIEDASLQAKDGIQLGMRELDYAITGLLPGQVVTVLAKTGAGKTAFISQVAHNLSMWQPMDKSTEGPGVPTLTLSLEQTKAEFATRLNRIGHLFNSGADEEEVGKWYGNFRINDENAVPPSDVRILVDEFIEEVGVPPKMLIVDYLGYWSRSFKGNSKYEQVTEAIMELKRIAKEYGVTVIAPHQVSRTGDRGRRLELDHARDSGAVEETSDFVLGLYRPHEARDDEDETKATWRQRADTRLDILKSRHGNVGKEVRMWWAPYSLALVPTSTMSLEAKVEKEWKAYDQMKTYDEVRDILSGKSWI